MLQGLKTYPLTFISGFIVLFAIVFTNVSQEQWNNPERVIYSDVQGYYAFLPAVFIHNDIELQKADSYGAVVWYEETEDGKRFMKYTCGMSILYSPFFLVAHKYAEANNIKSNGYTYPYRLFIYPIFVFHI